MEKHQRREIATPLSATLGAFSAKVSCLTPDCPFLEPSAQDVPGSRLGALSRGGLARPRVCIFGRNMLRNTRFTPLKADLDAEAPIFNF
ncbi:hypothetical protein LR48_Vigan07g174900 [Vigna angularis]|uniref:Uncharacterized protein n=1 Tax=Phaseolus angularis TaxID=3914 RepID=A0A0L9UYW7_PHAAN|nr:hypothetical protein LR48_Vigan07g174900 [Vigna angularis]